MQVTQLCIQRLLALFSVSQFRAVLMHMYCCSLSIVLFSESNLEQMPECRFTIAVFEDFLQLVPFVKHGINLEKAIFLLNEFSVRLIMAESCLVGKEPKRPSKDPFARFNILAQISMWWARPYLIPASQVNSTFISDLPQSVDVKHYADCLSQEWAKEAKKSQRPSFYRVLKQVFWMKYVWYMLPFALMACGQLGIAVALRFLVKGLADWSDKNCYILALVYSVVTLCAICMVNQGFLRGMVLGSMIRASISVVLYEKALTLSSKELSKPEISAKLTNLIGSATDIFELLPATMFLFITPFFVVISTPILWYFVGPAGLIAEAVALLMAPIKWYMTKCVSKLKKNSSELTESRIQLTQALLEGINSIKMYAMESQLLGEIEALKGREHKEHQHMNLLRNFTTTFLISGGLIVMLVLLVAMVGLDEELNAANIFGAMSILFTMNSWVNDHMSWGFDLRTWIWHLMESATEVMKLAPDIEKRTFFPPGHPIAVVCSNASATWAAPQGPEPSPKTEQGPVLVLNNVDLQVEVGKLCVVIGSVGSGKSSFLSLLAGVLKCSSGSVQIQRSVAYVENEPWLVPGAVKENITLGRELDEELYEKVLDMCSLRADLEQFPAGDKTLVGDKGSTLSGGQKARLALARAVYQDKDVYLLDDPLSAVDANVSAHIFNRCILEGLRGKTRILVTNQHSLLPQADIILVFRNGTLVREGDYEDIAIDMQASPVSAKAVQPSDSDEKEVGNFVGQIAEETEVGSVPLSIYINYFLFFFKSRWALLAVALVVGLVHLLYLGTSYWVSYWTAQSESEQQESLYPDVLAGIVGAAIIICILRNVLLMGGMAGANLTLHNQALRGVTHTTLSFFDFNPVGRILSRFTKDCWVMEDLFLKFYSDLLMFMCFLVGYMVAMVVTLPQNLPAMAVVCVLAVLDIRRFVPPTRQFKRLELSLKGDLIGQLGSSIGGLTTIRTLDLFELFKGNFTRLVSSHFQTNFCYYGNIQTFQAIMEVVGTLFVILNAFTSVIMRDTLSPSVAAVNFSFAVMINITMGAFTTFYVHTGSFMISGHRLYEYTRLPSEADPHTEMALQVSKGDIEFKAVDLCYAQGLPLALNHISFQITGGSKVGLIGRTGSGKSSILQSLFRLRETCGGVISIDGTDISKVGLQSLRSQLNTIPQSPLLFQGNVSDNLTSFGTYSSAEVETALKEVGLEAIGPASELSTGQRQLLCLARAFLQKTQIVLFDEPTGNIDPSTQDFVVQQVNRRFEHQTVVIIAHRLKTVMDCHTVFVLEGGAVVETGSPAVLAQSEGSRFQCLLKASGLSS